MAVTRETLLADFLALGISPGMSVIVHSSMKSMGWVEGGPEAVIEALIDAVGPEGTILMPTFNPPVDRFYIAETPSRTGLLTETFRKRNDVLRSAHPTHSVAAWGKRAAEFIAGHERATALGVGSPMHLCAEAGGYVLQIGVDFRTCSLIHVAEAIARVPYLEPVFYPGYDRPMTVVYPDGRERVVPPRENPGDSSGFLVVQEECERRGVIRHGKVGEAQAMLTRGEDILQATLDLLKRDVTILLCDRPTCRVCPRAREVCRNARRGTAPASGGD